MKLYSELEVRSLLNDLMLLECSVDEAIDSLTPIELPNVEEIHNKGRYSTSINGFLEGGLWVIEQIKQQDIGH